MSESILIDDPTLFRAWPKIARIDKDIIITEKIDGTNAAIGCTEDGQVWAQSRTRVLSPGKGTDNFGFAAWVNANAVTLFDFLGAGLHYGEWWGKGIQRGYNQAGRQFSLFNVGRWESAFNLIELTGSSHPPGGEHRALGSTVEELCVVPILYQGVFSSPVVQVVYDLLRLQGSRAAAGYDNPEGIVVYHTGAGAMFKLSDAK